MDQFRPICPHQARSPDPSRLRKGPYYIVKAEETPENCLL